MVKSNDGHTMQQGGTKIVMTSTSLDSHPSDDDIELYSLERLPDEQQQTIEEHLIVCEQCRQRLDQTDEFVAAMQDALLEVQQEGTQRSGVRPRGAAWISWVPKQVWAAAAVAAVAVAIVVPLRNTKTTATEVSLTAYRGEPGTMSSSVPAGSELTLNLDVAGLPPLPSYVVEVANAGGSALHTQTVAGGAGPLSVDVGLSLRAGQYWVRLYDPDDPERPLREFGLKVE